MFRKIVELRTQKDTGHSYIRVTFWRAKVDFDASKPPYLTEDFLAQLRLTGVRLTNPDDPSSGETFDRDLRSEIRDIIRRYIVRAKLHNYEGDNTSHLGTAAKAFRVKGRVVRKRGDRVYLPIERDEVDKHNVLTTEVKALRNTTKEELS